MNNNEKVTELRRKWFNRVIVTALAARVTLAVSCRSKLTTTLLNDEAILVRYLGRPGDAIHVQAAAKACGTRWIVMRC